MEDRDKKLFKKLENKNLALSKRLRALEDEWAELAQQVAFNKAAANHFQDIVVANNTWYEAVCAYSDITKSFSERLGLAEELFHSAMRRHEGSLDRRVAEIKDVLEGYDRRMDAMSETCITSFSKFRDVRARLDALEQQNSSITRGGKL